MASTITNIDLSALRKKRFTIDNDENRVLELDTSDLLITKRFSECYPKLEALGKNANNVTADVHDDEDHIIEDVASMGDNLSEVDAEMRRLIDYIFDSNVSELCAPHGSMYDPFGGQLRYEHILSALFSLYESNLEAEMKRVQSRVKSHTDKYTK